MVKKGTVKACFERCTILRYYCINHHALTIVSVYGGAEAKYFASAHFHKS